MKKNIFASIFLFICCILLISLANFTNKGETREYIRIHIRANSNLESDQDVKYLVKDAVVEYLTPVIAQAKSREDVYRLIGASLDGIQRTAERVLRTQGHSYGARAKLTQEEFPHRVYGEHTLERGVYDALIIELGEGEGDNWWCVIYPPLCFLGAEGEGDITYKSKILELIEKFKKQYT